MGTKESFTGHGLPLGAKFAYIGSQIFQSKYFEVLSMLRSAASNAIFCLKNSAAAA
jgi:hypothetical protein